ncbi:MAG: hypothetical protein M1839_005854 [Geoglossum umbratile]|nr:MAG: hypothetical protein M1839_005854 [Geoglossum umbratile]
MASCIAYNATILTEHSTASASGTPTLASLILPKIDHSSPQKLTYTHNQNFIHYVSSSPSEHPTTPSAGGLTYLVIAPSSCGRRLPFNYLLGLQTRFLAAFPPATTDFAALPPYGAAAFNSALKTLMHESSTARPADDALGNASAEIDDVRGIMTQNIERVLERGERIDLLVDKTDRLGGSAREFRIRSRGLRRKMWWKNVKLMVLLVFVIVFLVYLFVGFACGLPGESC